MENSKPFRVICQLFTVFMLILLSSPLITLAFFTSSNEISEQPIETVNAKKETQNLPDYFILNEDYSGDPPINKPAYDPFTVAERHKKNLVTLLPEYQAYYAEKAVYLTFDDGPDPENTPAVLGLLKKYEIKATFFVTGTQAEKYPDLLKQIYLDGHAIGNHSYNHIYRELYKSPEAYLEQLHHTDNIIKEIIGVRPHITRAPGGSAGSFNNHYWTSLKNEGYIEVGWNVSSGDASSANADNIFQNIVYQMNKKFLWSHAIILMHDGRGHSETIKALPKIIEYLKQQNFEFYVISLKTPPPW